MSELPLTDRPAAETSSDDPPLWDTERAQSPLEAAFHPLSSSGGEEEEDLRRHADEGGSGRPPEEERRTMPFGYESVTEMASDKLEQSGSVPLGGTPQQPPPSSVQVREHVGDLFDPQTLQTAASGCELPEQRTAVEGSQVSGGRGGRAAPPGEGRALMLPPQHTQLIIITGPGCEALASDGICTVIGGVAYNQVCASDPQIRAAADEDEAATGELRPRAGVCVCVGG